MQHFLKFKLVPLAHIRKRDFFLQASYKYCEAGWRIFSYPSPRVTGAEESIESRKVSGNEMEN